MKCKYARFWRNLLNGRCNYHDSNSLLCLNSEESELCNHYEENELRTRKPSKLLDELERK